MIVCSLTNINRMLAYDNLQPAKEMRPRNHNFVNQILSAMIQNHQLSNHTNFKNPFSNTLWATQAISQTLRSIPRLFFQDPKSVGIQSKTRHRKPLKQRNLGRELEKGVNFQGKDFEKVGFGVEKALEFFHWVEECFGFVHNEMTVREMGIVLAKGDRVKLLLEFLKEMSRRESAGNVVTTETVTCLIKCLGEEGLGNEALVLFYRMKQFRIRPDVRAYNVLVNALCNVGMFRKARWLLEQMELPGFRVPPDLFTYTILISAYCRHSVQTGCKKAVRRRLWEANHLFRIMLFKGFKPDVVTYNCLIDGCCKTYRIDRALELFDDMVKRDCVPNRVTYNSFVRYYSATNEIDKAIGMLRKMEEMNHGIPSTSSYTPIIHALCEAGRVLEARDLLVELVEGGFIPREYTYKLVCEMLKSAGRTYLLDEELCRRIDEGIESRFKQVMKVKPVMKTSNF